MFVFGTQYLRGATPARDQWARDMEAMRKMGFNTIRGWLVWNTIERAEGEVDYDYISAFLDTAARFDLQVGLLFHLHACPAWAVKKYNKYFYVDENNLPFEPAIRPNTPGGGWPGLCFDHEEVREMEDSLIRRVIAETKKHPNVAFYEPMNEPHQWVDYRRSPDGIFCYCDASVAKYRRWLEKKYGDIDTLNEAWGYFYRSFDEVRPPRWTTSYSDYTDFRLFTMDNIVEEIRFRSDIIRACDTKPVIAHAWGGGAVTCAQLGGMAFDDWKNAKVFDKWGYSAFPGGTGDCSSLGMGCDATRCAAGNKEYWQSELTAGINGTGLAQNGRLSDTTFNNFSLESIRHGAHGLLYWQFRKERFGSEFGGYAMTDYAGGPTNLTRCAERLCHMTQKNEDVLMNARQTPATVALIFSRRSYLASWASNWRKDNKYAVDCLNGYYRMFWEENIPVDILHEDETYDLSRYRLIVAPTSFALEPKFAAQLEQYIKNGGTFLSDPYFGAFDETMKLSYHVPGLGFDRVFGCEEDDFRVRGTLTLTDRDGTPMRVEGNYHCETFRNVTGETLYRYEDGTPAIVENRYGTGRAILSGINLGLPYSSRALISDDILSRDKGNSCASVKAILMRLCDELGIVGNPCTAPGVKASLLDATETAHAALVILINSNSSGVEGTLPLLPGAKSCSEQLGTSHATLDVQTSTLHFSLDAAESAVIRIEY